MRRFFKESVLLDLKNKDSIKQACSSWICELGELEGTFRKSDIAALKAFLSQSIDEIRMPYARRASFFARRTAFVGTVNDRYFLADPTGNRRFLPLDLGTFKFDWDKEELDQLWAEAWQRYSSGEPWWADATEEELLSENAERFRAKSVVEEKIQSKYAWNEPPDWKAGRQTPTEILEMLEVTFPADRSVPLLKSISAAVRKLWEKTGLAEVRDGDLSVKSETGGWVKLHSDSGKNRGWLMPPIERTLGLERLYEISKNLKQPAK